MSIRRNLLLAAAALAAGCDLTPTADKERAAREEARTVALQKRSQAACASRTTYDRLKQVAFDDAIRRGTADPENLDTLAAHSLVRIEDPVVVSRDEALDITLCRGRMVLDLPPGAERGFAGQRRLTADVAYSAQRAADGSGLVFQIRGAEEIVARLAAFDLKGYRPPATAVPDQVAVAPPPQAPSAAPVPDPRDVPAQSAQDASPAPRPPQPAQAAVARPSFNCRYARSRSERMVCGSTGLAALDREMSSLFYAALSNGDARTRAELRRSRDRFLAYRERCPNEDCVAAAYRDRMDEINDIAGW